MSKQIDFLKRCIALNLQSVGLLDLLDRIEELERERDAFYMDYRMKCDEEAKGSALVIIERDQLRAELVNALAACKAKDEALRAANHSCIEDWPLLREALAIQPDTSALEAIVKKAGEVMRRWATDQEMLKGHAVPLIVVYAIRALPAVTLDDLKGGA